MYIKDEYGPLDNLDFDFEGYIKKFDLGTLRIGEEIEYNARICAMFCRDVLLAGDNLGALNVRPVHMLVERILEVLKGQTWAEQLPMPWEIDPLRFLNEKGQRATSIYLSISHELKKMPNKNTTALISKQAEEHSISYETARASYYEIKNIVQNQKEEWPEKYINKNI